MTRLASRAVFTRPLQPLRIQRYDTPDPAAGEILVRLVMGGVCGSDVHIWQGDMGHELPFPYVMGHEAVGTVEVLGEGVTHDHAGQPLAVGDRVYWCPLGSCHRCYYCTVQKDFSSCESPVMVFTPDDQPTFATYTTLATLPRGVCSYRLADDTPAEAVIALGCALPAVLQGMDRLGDIRRTDDVVVQGAGPIGLSAVMLARLAGARRIIVIEPQAQRRAMARRFGATDVIGLAEHASAAERADHIRGLCGGRGADVVIEASGVLEAFSEGLSLLGRNGSYLVVGLWAGEGTVPVSPYELLDQCLRIVGTRYAQPEHYYRAMVLAERYHHDFPLVEAVTHRFAVEDSQQALDAVIRGEVVKAVIVPGAPA